MKYNRSPKITYPMLEQICKYKDKGIETEAVAKIVGCSHQTVNNYYRFVNHYVRNNLPIKQNCTADVLIEYAKQHGLPKPIFCANVNADGERDTEQLAEQIVISTLASTGEEYNLKRLIQAIDRLSNTIEVFWRNSRANMSANYAAEGRPKPLP